MNSFLKVLGMLVRVLLSFGFVRAVLALVIACGVPAAGAVFFVAIGVVVVMEVLYVSPVLDRLYRVFATYVDNTFPAPKYAY